MDLAAMVGRAAAELALFAGAGFLLFGINDLVVDLIYFARRMWRAITVYRRHRPAYASYWVFNPQPGFIAMFVPAWDEASVIASMGKWWVTNGAVSSCPVASMLIRVGVE